MKKTGEISGGNKLPIVSKLVGYPQVNKILIVGCGGTGSHLVGHISRLVSTIKREITLYLADGDNVESKNLLRQNFIHRDIGRNKAEVLGERYSSAFGIQIGVIPKNIVKLDDLKFFRSNTGSLVIVGCVDNNLPRRVMKEWLYQFSWLSKFWIDSGNEERYGQVVCGYAPTQYVSNKHVNPYNDLISSSGLFSLPCATEIYPNLLENSENEVSCAERALSAPQNMQTNVTAATLTMNYLNLILNDEAITSHGIEFDINNRFTTKLNTSNNLKLVNRERRTSKEL